MGSYYDSITGPFSIWIQNSSDEAYIIYFEENLGNMYQAWGLWKCDQAYYYTEYADESSDKYPGNKDGCSGDPVVFCPALGEDDINSNPGGNNNPNPGDQTNLGSDSES